MDILPFISKKIYGINGHVLPPFPVTQKNRNHYSSRKGAQIHFLIFHYTVENFKETLSLFTAEQEDSRTSAHYIIAQQEKDQTAPPAGSLFQVVQEEQEAWHAGQSCWKGMKNLNHTSIGIENVNSGCMFDEFGFIHCSPFDMQQIHTLGFLSQKIVKKYDIPPQHILGHADISPDRKIDPGILFPWSFLYHTYGIGAWLSDEELCCEAIHKKYSPQQPFPKELCENSFFSLLSEYGYNVTPKNKDSVLKAFKAHFSANQQPEKYNEPLTKEDIFWAWGLVSKYR